MKREPILADLLLANCDRREKWQQQSLDHLRGVKRFVFDAQAATYVGEMLARHPRIVADAMDFAIPPMRSMWVEIPFTPFYKVITGRDPDANADDKLGYLFDGPAVRVATGVRGEGQLLPIEYILHRPLTNEQELRLVQQIGTSRAQLDSFYWGESILKLVKNIEPPGKDPRSLGSYDEDSLVGWEAAGVRALRAHHSFRLLPMGRLDPMVMFDTLLEASAGDLRNIIALLLFLNRTREVQVVKEYGWERRMINRKPGALVTYSQITVHVNPDPIIRKLVAGEGVRRRVHDVRGHFCHDMKARQQGKLWCSHDWEETKPLHWHCARCGGQRWWRHEHTRGHLDEGLVIQQYRVTK